MSVGASCGRITIYTMPKMSAVKIIESPIKGDDKGVTKLMFVHSNEGLIVLYDDGSVYLIDLNKPISEPYSKLVCTTAKGIPVIFVTAFKEDKYWGLLRPRSSEFDIFKVIAAPDKSKRGKATQALELVNVPMWSCVIKDKLTLNKFEVGSSVSEKGIDMFDAKLIPTDGGFLCKVLYRSVDGEDRQRKVTMATFTAERRKIFERELVKKEVLFTAASPVESFLCSTFVRDLCVVCTPASILILDLNRQHFRGRSFYVAASLPVSDCFNGACDWSNSVLSASVIPPTEDVEAQDEVEIIISSFARPSIIRVVAQLSEIDAGDY